MEKPAAKIFLIMLGISFLAFLWTSVWENIHIGSLLEFGTIVFSNEITPEQEMSVYRSMAEYSIGAFIAYPIAVMSVIGFLKTTRRSLKNDGWLLMSAILFFIFIPVEMYCFWLDWKIVGLTYWGDWPIEEFRKAFIARVTVLAGLPFIAQLCYCTIPLLIMIKPLRHKELS
jgi:hypothetical protein